MNMANGWDVMITSKPFDRKVLIQMRDALNEVIEYTKDEDHG